MDARLAPRLLSTLIALASASACSNDARHPAVLDRGKVAAIVVGRSTRGDVFTLLGQPSHAERGGQGETWLYETKPGGDGHDDLVSGAAAASGLVGALVPYVGLLGSGLGLAGAAMDGTRPAQQSASLSVSFGDDGIVRDCRYATTAFSPGSEGKPPGMPEVIDCQRPVAGPGAPAAAFSPAPSSSPPAPR